MPTIRVSVVPPLFRPLFRWLDAFSGVNFDADPPHFKKGLKIGEIHLTEELLREIIDKLKDKPKK